MHKIILVDLYKPIPNSTVSIVKQHLIEEGFAVDFLPLSNLFLVISALLKRYFYNESVFLLIPADRLPERLFSILLRPKKLLAFQHGLRSSVRSKISFANLRKLPLYLIYGLGIFFYRKYDFFYVYDESTLSLYPNKITRNAKIRIVNFSEYFLKQISYNPSGNILFVDQPVDNDMLSKSDMLKKILLVDKIAKLHKKSVCVKFHPRTTMKNGYIWNEFNGEPISCAVGFSSSLLFNLRERLPIFSLLDKADLPAHLRGKVRFLNEIKHIFSHGHNQVNVEKNTQKTTLPIAIQEDLRNFYVAQSR